MAAFLKNRSIRTRKVGKAKSQLVIIQLTNSYLEENMNWIESLQEAINYMEEHLLESVSPQETAKECGYSAGHFQKGFSIVTGYSFSDYMRNRRLYLAALELKDNRDLKIVDVSLKYGYESPDALSRAFRKFHGLNPNQIRNQDAVIASFLPLQVHLSVRGGRTMKYQLQNIPEFTVIGKVYTILPGEDSYKTIPQKWAEFMQVCTELMNEKNLSEEKDLEKQAIWQNNIGEFGICEMKEQGLEYLIAGKYRGGEIPRGYEIRTYPAHQWAMFSSLGPLPDSLQNVNTQIFTEWLPQNPKYQLDGDVSIEYYPMGDNHAPDYQAQIWIPVKEK